MLIVGVAGMGRARSGWLEVSMRMDEGPFWREPMGWNSWREEKRMGCGRVAVSTSSRSPSRKV